MIRDPAEEAVDGSAIDDLRASTTLAIIGNRLELCLIGLFKVPIKRDLAEEIVDGSAFDDFSASSMLGDRLVLCLNGLFKVPMIRDPAEKQLMDQLLMISVVLLCSQ